MKHTFTYCFASCWLFLSQGAGQTNPTASTSGFLRLPAAHAASAVKNTYEDPAILKMPLNTARLDRRTFHLFSHGRPGQLLIDGKWSGAAEVAAFLSANTTASEFTHVNIYGCEFGKGETGKTAVAYLQKTLGVPVSASDDITGKDGDWELEVGMYASIKGFENYQGNLQYALGDDFDGDGIINSIDIDDDNDGIPDVIEAQCTTNPAYASKTGVTVTSSFAWTTNPSGGTLQYLVDGADASYQVSPTSAGSIVNQSIFRFDFPSAKALKQIELTVYTGRQPIVAGSVVQMQGSNDGTAWENIGSQITVVAPTTSEANPAMTSYKFSMPASVNLFTKYRIYGVSNGGANGVIADWFQEAYFSEICAGTDSDGDNIANVFDLDSDNDGCGDAFEGGASPTSSSTFKFTGTMGANGLDNSLETITDNGIVNYTSTYSAYAIYNFRASCKDTDNDGVSDLADIDDDNDGVLDAVESPACFYTSLELKPLGTYATDFAFLSSSDPLSSVYDNSTTTFVSLAANANISNKTLVEIAPPVVNKIAVSTVTVQVGVNNAFPSSSFQLEGWTGTAWQALSATQAMTTPNTTYTYSNTLHTADQYSKFRIRGLSGTATSGVRIHDVDFTLPSYVPSAQPKTSCADANIDGDGVPPHLDLDSDGDGCSDSYESGAILTETSNHQFLATPDANGNGLNDNVESGTTGAINYTALYYAYNAFANFCADTDGDGILDLVDLDDDNDGVLDVIECPQGALEIPAGIKDLTDGLSLGVNPSNTLYNKYGLIVRERNKTAPYAVVNETFTVISHAGDGDARRIFRGAGIAYSFEFYHPVLNSKRSFSQISVQGDPSTDGSTLTLVAFDEFDNVIYSGTYSDGSTITVTTTQTLNNAKIHRFIVSGSANTTAFDQVYIDELSFFQGTCDTDNDGIPNHFDLDSDGDGCPDAREAIMFNNSDVATQAGDVKNGSGGTVTSTTSIANAIVTGPYGSNGFADPIQAAGNADAYAYTYTYNFLAISADHNACADADGDGAFDFAADLDVDNDGILDAVESPSCFFTEAQAMDVTEGVTSDFAWITANPLSNTYDGDVAVYAQLSATATNIQNKALISFELPIIDNAIIDNIKVNVGATAFGTGTWQLEGLNNVNAWIPLSAAQAMNTASTIYTFSNTLQSTTAYHQYRIVGTNSVNATASARLNEFTIQYKNYNSSKHPVKGGCISDTDGDGVPNFLDLDSDGDGCPDAVEAGVSGTLQAGNVHNAETGNVLTANAVAAGPYGTNGLADGVETVAGSGIVNYVSTYNLYALSSALNVCIDSDGDGVKDLTDLDDDNDGILDAVEAPSCYYTATEMTVPAAITSEIPTTGTISYLYDNLTTPTFAFTATTAANAKQKAVFEITPAYPVAATSIDLHTNAATTSIFGTLAASTAILKAQGWNGSAWVDLATYTAAPATAANLQTFTFSNTTVYSKYRLYDDGTAGVNITAGVLQEVGLGIPNTYVASASPKPTCAADTDGDGIPNSLDLDSDGDGCSDAIEGGASFTSGNLVASSMPGGNSGGSYNGTSSSPVTQNLGNTVGNTASTMGVPTVATTGQSVWLSQNKLFNECRDSDGDLVIDLTDLDDDNDGILDAVEAPGCYYTAPEIGVPQSVRSDIAITTGAIANTYDNNTGTSITFTATTAINAANKAIFEITPQWPVKATALKVTYSTATGNAMGTTANSVRIEGWDGSNWVALTTLAPAAAVSNVQTFNISPALTTSYFKYRLLDLNAAIAATPNVTEVGLTVASDYVASANPKATCATDTDSDGITNDKDLDSDGDGCADSQEAGVVSSFAAVQFSNTNVVNTGGPVPAIKSQIATGTFQDGNSNGFDDRLETGTAGTYSGTYTYATATNNAVSGCPVCSITNPSPVTGTCAGANNLTFTLNLTGSNVYTTYKVTGATPSTGTYGTPTVFTMISGADGSNKTVTIKDGASASCTIEITVTGAAACDLPPKAVNDVLTAPVGSASTVNVLTNDDFAPGANTSLVRSSGTPGTASGTVSFNASTGVMTYTPAPDEAGTTVTVNYTVCNTAEDPDVCKEATVSITVGEITDTDGDGVPDYVEDTDNTDETDPCDYDPTHVTLTPSDAWKALDCDKDGNPNGTDPHVLLATATADVLTAPVGSANTVNVLTNDDFLPGANTSLVRASGTPGTAAGTVAFDPSTGVMTYTPTPGEAGTDVTVIYTVCNTAAEPDVCTNATVTITVGEITDTDGDGVPDYVEDTDNTDETDPCNYDPAHVTLTPSDAWKALDCDKDGNANGTDPHPAVASAVDDVLPAPKGTASTINVLTNDDFLPGANTSLVRSTDTPGTAAGTVAFDPSTGVMTYTPAPGEASGTQVTVIYTVCNTEADPDVCQNATVNISIQAPLPVTLVSFSGKASSEGNELKWTTADEKDFDKFVVEKTIDVKKGFEAIASVPGGRSTYTYTDRFGAKGNSYYRLKMVDLDGTYAYSKIISVHRQLGIEYVVYPNPASGHVIYIENHFKIESYKLFDAKGREVSAKLTNDGKQYKFTIDPNAQSGIYILTYKAGGKVFSDKFVLSE